MFVWVKPCKFAVVVSIGQNIKAKKKRKKDRQQDEKQNFLVLGDLVKSSNKLFIKSQRLFFFLPTEKNMMEWPRDTPCNVTEIKNNEMMKSFLVEWSCNHWFFSKKIFYIRKIRKKWCFRKFDHNRKNHKTHWGECR